MSKWPPRLIGYLNPIAIMRSIDLWPSSAKNMFCETCGRVGELDAEVMMECGPQKNGPCLWVEKK